MNGPADIWPSRRQAWYTVFVFGLTLMVNFLDRGILALLVEPIRRDLHLSDVQISLLMGFAFVCFYIVLGLPIARLVDSINRKWILTVAVGLWGITTACCGLAVNFWQLFACRIGVGVGEACSGPATFSMLSDLFPRERLPRAIAVLNFGFLTGNAGALIIGGTLVTTLLTLPPLTLPVIGTLHGWQLSFLIASIPALLVALLMLTVREPIRRGEVLGSGTVPPLREVARFLNANRATFGPMYLGLGFTTITSLGGSMWRPTFFIREFGWTAAHFGIVEGIMYLTVWPLGATFGAYLAERMARTGRDDANQRVVCLAVLCSIPGLIAAPLMPTAMLSIVTQGIGLFCSSWVLGPQNAALQVITPNRIRGQVTALYLFVFNVIGFGLGPTVVALIGHHVYADGPHALGYALATTTAVMAPLALLAFWSGLKSYGRSVAAARAWSQ